MNWFTGLVVYLILWWLVFFLVLPWGNRTPEEAGERPGAGMAPSAPVRPRLRLKAGVTTLIAAAIWAMVYVVVANRLITIEPAPLGLG